MMDPIGQTADSRRSLFHVFPRRHGESIHGHHVAFGHLPSTAHPGASVTGARPPWTGVESMGGAESHADADPAQVVDLRRPPLRKNARPCQTPLESSVAWDPGPLGDRPDRNLSSRTCDVPESIEDVIRRHTRQAPCPTPRHGRSRTLPNPCPWERAPTRTVRLGFQRHHHRSAWRHVPSCWH